MLTPLHSLSIIIIYIINICLPPKIDDWLKVKTIEAQTQKMREGGRYTKMVALEIP